MSNGRSGPPQSVPTLTEVVTWPPVAAKAQSEALPEPSHQALPHAAVTESELARGVLADVQRQVDLMLEVRLREALAPLLARAADALVRDARAELTATLRDVVTRAVAQELSRQRPV